MTKLTLSLEGKQESVRVVPFDEAKTLAAEWQRTLWISGITWSRWHKEKDVHVCRLYHQNKPAGEIRMEDA